MAGSAIGANNGGVRTAIATLSIPRKILCDESKPHQFGSNRFFRAAGVSGAIAAPDPLIAKLCGSMHQNRFRVWNSAQRALHRRAGFAAKAL